jgi:hypothetical protein
MVDCCLCREPLSNRKTTVTIREKGAKNIIEYSKLRNDSLCVEPGQTLHQDCRREYTNMKSFKIKGAQQPKAESRVIRHNYFEILIITCDVKMFLTFTVVIKILQITHS